MPRKTGDARLPDCGRARSERGKVGLSVPAGGQQAEQIPATVPAVPAEHAAKHDVFVSYNRKDSVQVRLLAELLQERKLIVWFDRTELLPGDPDFFMDEIAKGMRSSSSVVVVRGPHGVGPVQAEEVAPRQGPSP